MYATHTSRNSRALLYLPFLEQLTAISQCMISLSLAVLRKNSEVRALPSCLQTYRLALDSELDWLVLARPPKAVFLRSVL